MKTIKLFSIFQLDADRVLAIRDQVIKFLASPEKSDYDEIHIPSCFSKDYAISSVIKLTNSEHRIRHYDFIFDSREVDKASKGMEANSYFVFNGDITVLTDILTYYNGAGYDYIVVPESFKLMDITDKLSNEIYAKIIWATIDIMTYVYEYDKVKLCDILNNFNTDGYDKILIPIDLKNDPDIVRVLHYNPYVDRVEWYVRNIVEGVSLVDVTYNGKPYKLRTTNSYVAKDTSDTEKERLIQALKLPSAKYLEYIKIPRLFVDDMTILHLMIDHKLLEKVIYYSKDEESGGTAVTLQSIANKRIENKILDAIKEYAKPPKLEISEVSVTEDGVLRLNVKTIDDTAFSPDMMLNVIRAVNKTLRDNEEEILNGK